MAKGDGVYRIFMAAPADCARERKITRALIDEFDARYVDTHGVRLTLVAWDDTVGSGKRNQAEINRDVDGCDLFILCLNKHWGAPTYNLRYSSGTEEEFYRAWERLERTGTPDIFTFFSVVDREYLRDPGEQLLKIIRLKDIIKNRTTPRSWKIRYEEYFLPENVEGALKGYEDVLRKNVTLWMTKVLGEDNDDRVVLEAHTPSEAYNLVDPVLERWIYKRLNALRAQERERPLSLSEMAKKRAFELALAAGAIAASGRTSEAEMMYSRALDIFPFDGIIHLRFGNLMTLAGRHEEALTYYLRAAELLPAEPWAYLYLAATLSDLGRYEEALTAYNRVVELNPELGDAYYGKGRCLAKLGNLEGAAEVWEKALVLNPRNEKVYIARAKALINIGRYESAVNTLTQLAEIAPTNPGVYYHRACGYSLWGKRKKMLEDLEKAIEIFGLFRDMAATDPELSRFRDDPDFRRLVFRESPAERDDRPAR